MSHDKLLSAIASKGADIDRWTKNATVPPTWDARNQLMASFVAPGSSVVDVGAGAMSLKGYLPAGCTYQPVDVVQGAPETRIVNFNTRVVPTFDQKFDVAVCSGVMEYVLDPGFFIDTVRSWADRIVLSYVTTDIVADAKRRLDSGWVSKLSIVDLDELFSNAGLSYRIRARWQAHLIYDLRAR